jgi:predicted NAD/FAD-binding protein
MPKTKKAWSSWNYRMEEKDGKLHASTIYWMNSLQNISKKTNYFVSLNDPGNIDEKKIRKVIDYEHPLFDMHTAKAQPELPGLNEKGPVYFCGSYFRFGFHEDALFSAVSLCEKLLPHLS